MSQLTDTQLVILSAAIGRDDGAVLPIPKSIKVKGGALANVIDSMIRRGLVRECPASAEKLAGAVRAHWSVENGLHWVLDVRFRDDDCCIRKKKAPPTSPP